MVRRGEFDVWIALMIILLLPAIGRAQQMGSIRGTVYDKDFDAPLAGAQAQIAETGQQVTASDDGNYIFPQIPEGAYTLVFSKDGYARAVKADVVVTPGSLTEVNIQLAGDFVEMEEFVVQDVQLGGSSENALLDLRMASPALMDSISADLMSRAGAGDAASALNLVAGATVQEGKYAVIRGLPDRYVNSQMNGVRLPTADPDKRAVQLDQFPSAAIESIQVSKTFTPDQQGDASGGAVNIVLKSVPDEPIFKMSGSRSYNTNVKDRNDFLSYKGGGVPKWATDDDRDIPEDLIGDSWPGAVGVDHDDAPSDYKWSLSAGRKFDLFYGIRVGGFASFFYERGSSYYNDGFDDKYWIEAPGEPMTPQYGQGTPLQEDFKTSLFDVTRGSREVKRGFLGVLGIETDHHSLSYTFMETRAAEDVATLAEDTRGKAYYFYDEENNEPYDPDDPKSPGNQARSAAPYLRTETLQYTERRTETNQFRGRHELPFPEYGIEGFVTSLDPVIDWTIAKSKSELNQPDKRQFGTQWWANSYNRGFLPYVPPFIQPEVHLPFKPAANFTLGNVQRIWKDISEESDQYMWNLKLPFKQWSDSEGYLKFGVFRDEVERSYNQDSFSNFNDNTAKYLAPWDKFWSAKFPYQDHPITEAEIDVDYEAEQVIDAYYYMADIPLTSWFNVIGGYRHESTELSIINDPEEDVTWIPPDSAGSVTLNEGDADVFFEQDDILPSIGFKFEPLKQITMRGSYSETVARQTFKELTPIQQQEFLGGDVFIGNPYLQMSAIDNYDLRLDIRPFDDALISGSYFTKDVTDPIEYVQRIADFPYTTAVNYPEGGLNGYELEARQGLGHFLNFLDGLTLGGNATFIESEVTLPEEEAEQFEELNIEAPMRTRDMTNAPEHLYNMFVTYNLRKLGLAGTDAGVFYTVRGDTLVAGAGQSNGKYVPNVYEVEYGTLNASLSHKFWEHCKLVFKAKNLLDPAIETVYRSKYMDKDVKKTSYTKGMEFSLGLELTF